MIVSPVSCALKKLTRIHAGYQQGLERAESAGAIHGMLRKRFSWSLKCTAKHLVSILLPAISNLRWEGHCQRRASSLFFSWRSYLANQTTRFIIYWHKLSLKVSRSIDVKTDIIVGLTTLSWTLKQYLIVVHCNVSSFKKYIYQCRDSDIRALHCLTSLEVFKTWILYFSKKGEGSNI